MNPLVTIIVPIFNVERYISRCLDSIQNQIYQNIECLLIDDCGQDHSIQICNDFIRKYTGPIKFSIISHKQNKGLSGARNTGIRHANGCYLYFLDSDDYIEPQCISVLIEAQKEVQCDMVVGNYQTNTPFQCPTIQKRLQLVGFEQLMRGFIAGEYYVMAWNKLIKKDFFLKNDLLFPEGIIHEDIPWMFRCINCVENVLLIPDITYNYMIRDGSISTDRNTCRRLEAYKQGLLDSINFIRLNSLNSRTDNYTELALRCLNAIKISLKICNFQYLLWFSKLMRYCITKNPQLKNVLTKNTKDRVLLFPFLILGCYKKHKSIDQSYK